MLDETERISNERLAELLRMADETGSIATDKGELYFVLRELQALRKWRPISECPDKTRVFFLWSSGKAEAGRMEHNALRMNGQRKDSFWGGPFAITSDDDPPIAWTPFPPLPAVPESKEGV